MSKLKIIILITGIYIFWLLVLPIFLTNTVGILCKNFSHNSNYELEITNPKVKLNILPTGTIKAEKVLIRSKQDSAVLNVENVKIKIRLLPLLSGRAHVNTLRVGKVELSVNLVEDLRLAKDFFVEFEKRPFRFDNLTIGEFKATLYKKDLAKPIEYKGEGFTFQRKNRYVKLKTNSSLNISGNVSKVTSNLYLPKNNDINNTIVDVEVSNLDLAPLKNYFQYYLPKDLLEIRGRVNVHANKGFLITEMTNCAVIMKDEAKSILFPEKMEIKSRFNIKRNYINFDEIDIDSKDIHLSMNGKIQDYFGKTMPTLDFNVIINKSRVEDFVKLLPPFKVEEIDVYYLKKYKFYGDILANFSIKGRLPEPDIFGDFYVDNGILIKPIPNTTKGATIKISLSGRQADFDVAVPAGNLEKVWVKGTQEIYNTKYAELTVKSTEAVDLKSAQDVVNPLHEILNFIIGPVPITDINGKGNIDIIVKGNRRKPHVWGVFNIKNGHVSFNDISNLVLENADATLKFNDQNVVFNLLEGFVNNKKVSVNGTCDLFGNFDFDVLLNEQQVDNLYKIVKTSAMLYDIQKMVPKLDMIRGLANLKLKVFGSVKDINDLEFNKNVFAKGNITLKDNKIKVQSVEIANANGNIDFDTNYANADLKATIGDLPLSLKTKIKNTISEIFIDIPKLNPNFLLSDEETRKKLYLPYISLKGSYVGVIPQISGNNELIMDLDKLNMSASILGPVANAKIQYQPEGVIKINNNKIAIKGVKGYIDNSQNEFDINLDITDAFSKKPEVSGDFKLKTPNLSLFNEIMVSEIIPREIKKYTRQYEFKKGSLDLKGKVSNNKLNLYTDLSGISFVYLPLDLPIDIINGSLAVKNNIMKLNKINFLADNMPVLADGEIKDILGAQNFNLYFNSKPHQDFIDKYINKNQIYPVKIKGDIVYWIKLKGVKDNFDLKAKFDMSKESSFYHFGATIGDNENAISVYLDSKILDGNSCKIREFSYDKMIDSQSGKVTKLNMLKAFGGVKVLKDDLAFDNLNIKTNHPTDARIFNIIFRKPNIKQGQFTSDLKINGKLSDAKVLGVFHIFETNIPFLDISMKNIELLFKDRIIEFASKGDVMGNDIVFDGVMKNKLVAPYRIERANFYAKKLDLNRIINELKTAEVDNVGTFESLSGFDINLLNTKNFRLKADAVELRNIHATDFEAMTSISEKGVFDVEDFQFNIAQGVLKGKTSYNLKNNDMSIDLDAESISANDITWALFDLNNQIYGDLTGNIKLTCNGSDFNNCMQTLNGNTIFNVKDGRMPKLGSLEYLLKAGNLVKSGFTGVSINSVIELLSPSKTGEFSDIFGSIRIKDGIARNVEITTRGKDLSLFVGGTYNFATSVADMEVLGLLSRKISTMLGPIGNVSINTLFNVIPGVDLSKDTTALERINKIPGIELSSKAYRKFIAEIKGNINGDDYVTSFKWIN